MHAQGFDTSLPPSSANDDWRVVVLSQALRNVELLKEEGLGVAALKMRCCASGIISGDMGIVDVGSCRIHRRLTVSK